MHSPIVGIAIIALLNIEAVLAQETIVGCATLPCPTANDNTTSANCFVVDKTFTTIGIAQISVTSNALKGLSWTEGVAVIDSKRNRIFDTSFYLGVPPDTNLTGTGACALFLNKVSSRVIFEKADTEEQAQGTCQEAMSPDCVNALIKRATDLDVSGLGSADVCKKLQTAFDENLDSVCSSFADGSKWLGLGVRPLVGAGAASPITQAENSTSNCWPVMPVQNKLTLVNSIVTPGDFLAETLSDKFFGITPILTFFYPGTGKLITQAEAQLTCMKTVGPSVAANATMNNGQSRVGALQPPIFAALATALTLLTFAVL